MSVLLDPVTVSMHRHISVHLVWIASFRLAAEPWVFLLQDRLLWEDYPFEHVAPHWEFVLDFALLLLVLLSENSGCSPCIWGVCWS
jgi:hypothetical protein